jgi:hypothetical protein
MNKIPWLAFFFDCVDDSHAPLRTEVVEADNEDDAAKLANEHLGDCLRVAIARPAWVSPDVAILAREAAYARAARRRAAPAAE